MQRERQRCEVDSAIRADWLYDDDDCTHHTGGEPRDARRVNSRQGIVIARAGHAGAPIFVCARRAPMAKTPQAKTPQTTLDSRIIVGVLLANTEAAVIGELTRLSISPYKSRTLYAGTTLSELGFRPRRGSGE